MREVIAYPIFLRTYVHRAAYFRWLKLAFLLAAFEDIITFVKVVPLIIEKDLSIMDPTMTYTLVR